MKISPYIIPVILILLTGCKKDEGPRITGTDTIDNTLYSAPPIYYAIGFSFEEGKKVNTETFHPQDITVHANTDPAGGVTGARLDTPNLVESFALAGEFNTESEAIAFYNSLSEVGTYNWVMNAAEIRDHQVWIFKTVKGNYVKFRTIEVIYEQGTAGPYSEVTFRWRIQPDGTTTFPAE